MVSLSGLQLSPPGSCSGGRGSRTSVPPKLVPPDGTAKEGMSHRLPALSRTLQPACLPGALSGSTWPRRGGALSGTGLPTAWQLARQWVPWASLPSSISFERKGRFAGPPTPPQRILSAFEQLDGVELDTIVGGSLTLRLSPSTRGDPLPLTFVLPSVTFSSCFPQTPCVSC